MKRFTLLLAVLMLCGTASLYAIKPYAGITSLEGFKPDSTKVNDGIKRGWTFGALPSVAYNSDLGFQYGALAEIYNYGDGSTFPQYKHMMYVEGAYTTKRSGLFRFFYDSKYLIRNTRFTFDLTYIPDQMNDFYGFNGYQSVFNPGWAQNGSADYVSRAFYKQKTNFFRATADFQGAIVGNLYWNAGIGVFNYVTSSVDLDNLNRNKADDKKLPNVPTLFDLYNAWGLIDPAESEGGTHPFVRAGFTFDTRNKPNNPSKGIWADVFATYYAAFGTQKDYNNVTLSASFRHYVPLWKDRLILAYRVGYQGLLAGETPYYMKNYMGTLYTKRANYQMLGGCNSLRGIIRNRVTGDGYAYANVELRMKLFSFNIARQAFYVGVNPLIDLGYITDPVDLNVSEAQLKQMVERTQYRYEDFFTSEDGLHVGAGAGLKIAMNENFILSVDYAKALNKQDGNSGLYIQIGYMF